MSAPRRLLIVEDDQKFAAALQRSFERKGYEVVRAHDLASLMEQLRLGSPQYAVVDLKLARESGLECVKALHDHNPDILMVVLTGFASIATAVEAIKLGACHYLAKPSNSDDIEAAFAKGRGDASTPVGVRPTSIKTLEWEHIHEALRDTDFNISETARRLGMHRRTLARKLEKRRLT
jgi:two-component system response regulator RegA